MSKSDNIIPVLVLGGFALVLLYAQQKRATAGVTGTAAPMATSNPNKTAAVTQIINGAFGLLSSFTGGVTGGYHSSAAPTESQLDQVVETARQWTAANGTGGVSGDPYNPDAVLLW